LLLLTGGAAAQGGTPPNVVFFLADDLGYMDIGANNPDSFYETPSIDRIAREGVRFTAGYAACPVCSPTRASIVTGKVPPRTGITDFIGGNRAGRLKPAPNRDRLSLDEVTIAERFREAGYATFFAGKWHLGPEGFWPENQGFDLNRGGWSAGGPYGPGKYFSPYGNPRLRDGPPGEHLPARLAAEAVSFIEAHRDRPFFAYVSFYSVHTPLMAREDLRQKYLEKKKRLGLEAKWGREREREVRLVQEHAVYAGMVEAMDQAVGTVLAALDRLELGGRTVVVFTSDNGGLSTSEGHPTSNHPLRAGKGWLYEGGIREPYLIKASGVAKPGGTCDTPVLSTDFYATLLELAGLPARPEQHADSASLVPLLRGGALERGPLFWHYPHYGNQGGAPSGAVRDGDWKLIEWYEDGSLELFNLREDPGETSNLAAREPDRAAGLRRRLEAWRRDTGCVMPAPVP
jgi:arylsulfatase A-like enzyme